MDVTDFMAQMFKDYDIPYNANDPKYGGSGDGASALTGFASLAVAALALVYSF